MSNILEKLIEKYPNKPWNWGEHGLSSNPSITPEFIEKHIDKPWNWGEFGLSKNPSITLKFIEKHIDKDWEWGEDGLSSNKFLKDDYFTSVPYIRKQQKYNSIKLKKN